MHEVVWRALRWLGKARLHLVIDGDLLALCGAPSTELVDSRGLLGPAAEKCTDCVVIATAAAAMAKEVPSPLGRDGEPRTVTDPDDDGELPDVQGYDGAVVEVR